MTRRIPRTKGAFSGLLIILLGLWGGLIPFVGPYFNYQMHNDQTWFWFNDRLWLEVLPAAAALLGGLILMFGVTRASTSLGGLLALAGGLWFLVGPSLSILWNHGAIDVGPPIGSSNGVEALEWIGFFYGTGALITLFSSYAIGFLAGLPIVDERIVGPAAASAAGAGTGRRFGRRGPAAAAPTAAPARTTAADTEAAPRTRSGRFFRRRRSTTSA
jgi:hypothetical protein